MTGRMRKLRPAEPADIQAVQLLLRRENLPLEGVAEHIEDFLVAEQEGSIVGCAGVERYEQYFARRGFKRVARDRVNPELFDSAEFCGACPTTAVCMRLQIVQH